MNILIFGAGGVGSVIGGFLARAGHSVTLLGRAWHLDVIQKNGLTITGIWGDYRIKAFDLYTDVQALKKSSIEWDLIILTVKAHDTEPAVEVISSLMRPHTMLLSLQNGLGNRETILRHVKPEAFVAGRFIFDVQTEPGVVRVTVNPEPIFIGAMPGVKPFLSAVRLASIFRDAKIPAEAVADGASLEKKCAL